ncbi:MAG: bacteriocin [Saccharofermentans sp.]|nr:bacteriocin [Saccharofermentans sp.]
MPDKIKVIMDKFKADPELAKKYGEEVKKLAESKAASSDGELVCMAIKNVTGEEISIAEIERFTADKQELSEEELEKVSGGDTEIRTDDSHEHFCWHDYACFAAYRHRDEIDVLDACFHDWTCAVLLLFQP